MSRARERSVQSLQHLYTVVVGLSLAAAVGRLIDVTAGAIPVRIEAIPVFVSFLAVVVPFYHGTMQHLQMTYVEEGGRGVRDAALLADFVLLFLEACLLFAAAQLIPRSWYMAWTLVLLLGFDALWGTTVYLILSRARTRGAEWGWILINVAAAPVLAVVLVATWGSRGTGILPTGAAVTFMSLMLIRTIADYRISWSFYYPRDALRESGSG